MSLYLKYRPQNFMSVVGQDHAKKTIQNALSGGSLAHAYLFSGPRGTGKTSLARILAKGLNCIDPQEGPEPCNKCEICESINTGRLVDLIEIDAASNRGIDEIRELREKIVFAPSQAKSKVYIIDEVHMLTKEAFNALLKTLEEPPLHAYFVLATTEAHKIPETIISRCQQFSFSRIAATSISDRLEEIATTESATADKEALDMIAKLSNGGLRDAIGLLEQMITSGAVTVEAVADNLGLTGDTHLQKFFDYLVDRKPLKAIELLSQMKAKGHSMNQFLQEIIGYMREQMLISLGKSQETMTIIGFIDIFTHAKSQLDLSPIPELPIEIGIIKACGFEVEKNDAVVPEATEVVSVKKVEEVKVPEPKKESAEVNSTDLNFEKIKNDWARVMEAIETPFIKLSLQDGTPKAFEAGILTIAFNSGTFMEKIGSSGNQADVQSAFKKVFGRTLELDLQTKKVDLTIAKKEEKAQSSGEPTAVEMASEVFGIN